MKNPNHSKLNEIQQGDCLELMAALDEGTVDLLLTDPPYNVSMKSGFHTMGRKGVDFGEWDKEFDQRGWLEIACSKVRKGGSVVIFNDYKNIGLMTDVLQANGFIVKELLIWKKPNPMPRNRDRLYVTSIEVALWAVKGKGWTFNRQKKTYENAIFESASVGYRKRIHPTQKPEKIIKEILAIHSNEGDIILDCFMGSGTTALAALDMNRYYIGMEIDEEYCKVARQRVNEWERSQKPIENRVSRKGEHPTGAIREDN